MMFSTVSAPSAMDSVLGSIGEELAPYNDQLSRRALIAFGQVAAMRYRIVGNSRRKTKGKRAKRGQFYAIQKRDQRGWMKFNPLLLASLKET